MSSQTTFGLVVAEDPSYLDWLQSALGANAELQLVQPSGIDDLARAIQSALRTDVVFVQAEPETQSSRCSLLSGLGDRFPDLPTVAVGPRSDPDLVLATMRAGASDFFVLRRDDGQVTELLSRVLRRSFGSRAGSQGKLLSVVSGHPYDGVVFTAEHLALASLERQNTPGARVLLVDAAMPAGAGAVYLNISQNYSLLDAVNDLHRCDQTLVETAFPKHSSGLYLLSLPEDSIGVPRLNYEQLLQLLDVFRSLFAVTVVTLDSTQPLDFLSSVIGQADRSVVLSDQSILKSRHNKYLLRSLRLDDCALDRTGLVVDNYRRRLGLEPEHLAELLELPLLATLSGQPVNRIQAMNSGESMFDVAPKDSYCRDMEALAGALLSGRSEVVRETGLLAKLFG